MRPEAQELSAPCVHRHPTHLHRHLPNHTVPHLDLRMGRLCQGPQSGS